MNEGDVSRPSDKPQFASILYGVSLIERRRQRRLRIFLIVILFLVAAVGVYACSQATRTTPLGADASVCDLIGMTYDEATQYVNDNGLDAGVLPTQGQPVNLIHVADDGHAIALATDQRVGWPNRICVDQVQ